jgi:hypothetical protein
MITPTFDQTIPVLTEVFANDAVRPAAPPEPEPEREPLIQDEPAPDADAIGAELEALATDTWTEPEWRLLEQRIAGRILRQLDARIDAALDRQLRDSLADVLQQAMVTLAGPLRAGLQLAIEQTVAQAVAQEMAALGTHRK